MSNNPFVLPDSAYKRNIDPVKHYVEQAAQYLFISTRKPYEVCEAFVKASIRDRNLFPAIRDPKMRFFERQENGDRLEVEGSLLGYITDSVKKGDLIAPTLTTYIHPREKESLLVTFIDANVKGRSIAKKEMFAAKAEGDFEKEKVKNIEQTNRKLSNNSISGAHVSASTPLANKTAHSTLTSNCRSTSGYGNANNEKLLCGNRHYWNSQITLANIVSIVTHTNYYNLEKAINKFNITLPTVQDCMDCVTYSSSIYWNSKKMMDKIEKLFNDLTPLQRAAFVYTGDLYHLMKHNDGLLKSFIGELSSKITEGEIEDPIGYLKKSPEDSLFLAHQICSEEMKGHGKKYDGLTPKQQSTVALTVKNIDDTLQKYSLFIEAFLVTDNMPASVAYFPESVRKAALTSDTDSTIFTVQDWVKWYKGEIGFDQQCMSVAVTMIFLASQTITHILSQMSANFGIEEKRLHQIAMKNEFTFDVFVPTNVAKHYYAIMSCQEGNVFTKHEEEIKGVHLKSSNAPKAITKKAANMMREIMDTVYKGQKISILKFLKEIADTEREIIRSIKAGDLEYFRLGEIKTPDSYTKSADESPYSYHILWNSVFGQKYGMQAEPPYQTIRVSTILENPTATIKWLTEMEDKQLSERMRAWLDKNERKFLPSIMIPVEAISANGVPKELLDIMDIRKIVYNLCKIFYLVLETLGFYICNDNMTKLASDFY